MILGVQFFFLVFQLSVDLRYFRYLLKILNMGPTNYDVIRVSIDPMGLER